ncbi:MAG: hypothetical protein AAFX07_06740 [Pseudomonadota bacterium]
MTDKISDDAVVEHLTRSIDAGTLPKSAQDYAQHLLNRLSQPVRVSVLGAHKTGKSELINMLLGRALIPSGAELPTTEVIWGEKDWMTVTAADGSVTQIDTADMTRLNGMSAAFLQVAQPLEILKKINLLEVVTENSVDELSSGVDWAVRRTDIALWCTQDFNEMEREVWRNVPDSMKDHAFLVLTKADQLSAQNVLSKRVNELQQVVAEEFHSLYAVATLQAISAFGADGLDSAKFKASGGEALTYEVLKHAERGRRADLDSAHMFLVRYKSEVDAAMAATPKPAKPAPAAPKAVAVSTAKTAAPTPEPKLAAPAPATQKPTIEHGPKVENVALFSDAIRFLKRRGDSLAETLTGLEPGNTKDLIETCVDAVEHLTDLFSQDESGCDAADAFIDELAEASDVMVLMQVEDGDAPAADAVTLLLQLRHDMEMQLAA